MFSETDYSFMRRALDLAERGLYTTTPNPRVGAVLVKNGEIIGEGHTQPPGLAHAEVMALLDARQRQHEVQGATAYVTLEPCSHFGRTPPCTTALIEAGVTRVIAAMEDPNPLVSGQGFDALRAAGIEVRCGLLAGESRALNLGFVSRMIRKRPWVRVKVAGSLDGRTALNNGDSQWITGEDARRDAHAWRARACAIMSGIGTVKADDPLLNVRLVQTPRQPPRMILDRNLEISLESKLVRSAASGSPVTVFATRRDAVKAAELGARGCEVVEIEGDVRGRIDLAALMQELCARQINELHLEAGSRMNGAFLQAKVVDELLVYVAPCLLGPGQPLAVLPELDRLDDKIGFQFSEVEMVGRDLRVLARIDDLDWVKER